MTIPRTVYQPNGPPRPCVEQEPEWGAELPCGYGGGSPPVEAFGPKGGFRPKPETTERPYPPGRNSEPERLPLQNARLSEGCSPPDGHGKGSRRGESPERSAHSLLDGRECLDPQTMKPDVPPWGKCTARGLSKVRSPVHPPGCWPNQHERALGPPGWTTSCSRGTFGTLHPADEFLRDSHKDETGECPARLAPNRTGPNRGRARGDSPLSLRERLQVEGASPSIAAGPPGDASMRCPPGVKQVPAHPPVPTSMREGVGSRAHVPPGVPLNLLQRKPGSRAPSSTRTGGTMPPEQPTYQGG